MEAHELRQRMPACPCRPEDSGQVLYVQDSLLADREDRVREPCNTDRRQFFVEEVFTKLFRQNGELLYH